LKILLHAIDNIPPFYHHCQPFQAELIGEPSLLFCGFNSLLTAANPICLNSVVLLLLQLKFFLPSLLNVHLNSQWHIPCKFPEGSLSHQRARISLYLHQEHLRRQLVSVLSGITQLGKFCGLTTPLEVSFIIKWFRKSLREDSRLVSLLRELSIEATLQLV